VIILDCCYSGAFIDGELQPKDINGSVLTKDTFETQGRGTYVLASSTKMQRSYAANDRSLFTRYLVEGLRTGAAAPESKVVTIRDLAAYVSQRLRQQKPDLAMTPSLLSREEGDALIIAGNPNRREPVDQKVIDGLRSKESKDIVPQIGAIYLLGEQLRRLSDLGRDQAENLLKNIAEDDERVEGVRRAARSILNPTESAKQVLALEWKRNPDDIRRDADELLRVREQLTSALENNRLVSKELEQAKSVEAAKQVLGAEWKRDTDEVLHDAKQLESVRVQLADLNAQITPATEKKKQERKIGWLTISVASLALATGVLAWLLWLAPPSLAVMSVFPISYVRAKAILDERWKEDPEQVENESPPLLEVTAERTLNQTKIVSLTKELSAAQTVPAAKAILAPLWKQDPDDVKRAADELPATLQQRDSLQHQLTAVEAAKKQEQSIVEKAKQDLAMAQTVPAAKAILAADWKQDPDVVKQNADKLPATVQQLAAAQAAEQQEQAIADKAKQDLAMAQTVPAAKAILGADWKQDPDVVKQNADKLPATVQQLAAAQAAEQQEQAIADKAKQDLAMAQTVPAAKAILAADWKQDPDVVKQNADKLRATVQQLAAAQAAEQQEQAIADKAKQDLAAAQTLPAVKAILASYWKQDPDDVKRNADKLPATVQQVSTQQDAISGFGLVLDNYVTQGQALDKIDSTTQGECFYSCAARSDCKGFTYTKSTQVCHLRSKVNNLEQDTNAFSAVRIPPDLPADISIEPY
jgi:hypothetical protein